MQNRYHLQEIDKKGATCGAMKTVLVMILIVLILLLFGEIHGFKRGYELGRKETNAWWIDQKSRLYDTSELLKKDATNGFNQI